MKRILITGKNSYIGTSLEKWLLREPENYLIDSMDLKDYSWKEKDFSLYDVVFHVAGIAHVKEKKENKNLYFEVNRDLTYEVALKAKNEGVKQFIFLSSMSVYGLESGIITLQTVENPVSAYGQSKLQAEHLINKLQDASFVIAILRPPLVYGKGCKGNYPRLAKLALKTPVFPNVENKRSMIYIDNLSEFVKQLIDNRSEGLFFPQNSEYVNTSEMVRLIAKVHGRGIRLTKLFNPILLFLSNTKLIQKVFGNLVYEKYYCYADIDFKKTIQLTEEEM